MDGIKYTDWLELSTLNNWRATGRVAIYVLLVAQRYVLVVRTCWPRFEAGACSSFFVCKVVALNTRLSCIGTAVCLVCGVSTMGRSNDRMSDRVVGWKSVRVGGGVIQ